VGVGSIVNIVAVTVVFWLAAETGNAISAHVRRRMSNARLFFMLEPPGYQWKETRSNSGQTSPKRDERSHERDQISP
jgi:hypothetical protein